MGKLRNWKHEKFAEQIVAGTEPAQAYVIAGFEAHRTNHFRLLRQPRVAARVEELTQARADAARAARVSIDEVLTVLRDHGITAVADFFDRNAAGILSVRDLSTVRPEVFMALLRSLREAFGIDGSP
jgi:hypothetical protein